MNAVSRSDWMAPLDGRLGLGELTIPGTHDSGALRGARRDRTQAMGIPEQLRAGIRFLDVRLRDDAGVFRVFHGSTDQRTEFAAGVLRPLLGFLAEHPGETVVMSVDQEDGGDPAAFARDLEQLLGAHAPSFHTAPEFPRLADARGKIVLMRRFSDGGLGIPADRWQNDTTFPLGGLRIEDEWELAGPLPGPFAAKWRAVQRNLDAAASSATDWYVTFTSATSDFVHPRAIARGFLFLDGMNRRLLAYLAGHPGRRRLGTVVMDFPDQELIDRLASTNG